MHDVAAHRIMRCGALAILMLDPEGVVRNVVPTVIVGIGKATIARESERKIDEAVLAGDSPVAMVADRQIFDDQFQLAIDAVHSPNFLAVFGNIGLPVFRTVADLIHHGLECAFADLAHKLASSVKYLTCAGSIWSASGLPSRTPEIATQRLPS